jgi:hypothetical protein
MIEQKSQRHQSDTMAQTVFVASADLLTAWTSRTASNARLTTFSDADLEGAIEAIFRSRPNMVVVEDRVAAIAQGPKFIKRLQTDPDLTGLDVRLIDVETITSLIESPELARRAPELLAERAEQLPAATRRRMTRFKVPQGVELVVDGSAAMLVDVSTIGAQVLSCGILRPKQQVRVTLPEEEKAVRLSAEIAWSALELPKSGTAPTFYDTDRLQQAMADDMTVSRLATPHYRVGLKFVTSDSQIIQRFCSRLKKLA